MKLISTGRRHWLALAIYLCLALAITWPLATHLTTHVTGDGIDDPALAWNLWWAKARLLDQLNPDLFHVDWMFHPIQINLAFYTLTPLNGLLSIPIQIGSTLIVATNALLLASFVLSGFGAYLLAYDQLRRTWCVVRDGSDAQSLAQDATSHAPRTTHYLFFLAALFAGIVYAAASAKVFYAGLGQFNIASSQWIPFCVLYLTRMVTAATRRETVRAALLAGIFLTFQAWAELTYASFLLLFAALLAIWRLTSGPRLQAPPQNTSGQRSGLLSSVLGFGIVGLVFLVGVAPFLWAMLPDMRQEGDFFAVGGGFADIFSADLMGFLAPTRLHPLFGAWAAALPFPNDKGQHIFLGYGAMALAGAGSAWLLRQGGRPARWWGWLWVMALACFWLLSLGPHPRWAGQDLPLTGPFALVSQLPFFSGNRYPSRYSVMLLLCVAVLAATGLCWLLATLASRRGQKAAGWVAAAAAVLFLFEHLSLPMPISDLRSPPIYARLAAVSDPAGVLLELPTGWRNGARVLGKSDLVIMLQEAYQTAHGLRRLGGNTSRNPLTKFQYFTEAPLLGDLIALMNADRPHIAAVVEPELDRLIAGDRAIAAQVLDFLGIEAVTVHVEKAPPALLRFVAEALPLTLVEEWQGTDWSGAPATIRLYRFAGAAPGDNPWTIRLNDRLSKLYLGEGWSALPNPDGFRLATRREPILLLDLPTQGGELTISWRGPATGFSAAINGRPVPVAQGTRHAGTAQIEVPAGLADQPVDRLTLTFNGDPLPARLEGAHNAAGNWPVGATGIQLPAATALVVRSAGEEVGDFAQIWINGVDVARNERGYNLAAMDTSGRLLDRVVFDTMATPAASLALADWLGKLPPGTVVAGAVADEASMNLGQTAVDTLARLGVASDLRGKFRWSHAFVGAVGALPGTALEQSSLLQPATVAIGAPIDGAAVYGGVESVTFTPKQPE